MKIKARQYPDHMYVTVPAVTKAVSGFVVLLCMLSLVISFATGFTLIARLFALLFAFFGSGFYLMASRLERQYSQNAKP